MEALAAVMLSISLFFSYNAGLRALTDNLYCFLSAL